MLKFPVLEQTNNGYMYLNKSCMDITGKYTILLANQILVRECVKCQVTKCHVHIDIYILPVRIILINGSMKTAQIEETSTLYFRRLDT